MREITALRCGLDAAMWEGSETAQCGRLLDIPLDKSPKNGEPLPFDLARAYAIYRALFGEVEDLIKGKSLLVVPAGPLTQLPFQTLVTALPKDVPYGERQREVGLLGAELRDLTLNERQSLKLPSERGVG